MRAHSPTSKRVLWLSAALLAAVVAWLAFASEASAGTYTVRECDIPQTGPSYGVPDAGAYAAGGQYSYDNQCGVSNGAGLTIAGNQTLPQGSIFEWNFYAPGGTRFLSGGVDLAINNCCGHETKLHTGVPGSFNGTSWSGNTSGNTWQRVNWSAPNSATTRLTLTQTCPQFGGCAGNDYIPYGNFTLSRQYVFNLHDSSAPSASLGGALVSGGWKSGSFGASISGSDVGGGVRASELYVNGTLAQSSTNGCGELGGGLGFRSFTPCPGSDSDSYSVNVGSGPFNQGSNSVVAYTRDVGSSPNYSSASSATVMVDSIAPAQVGGLAASVGESWQPTRDFDISWSTPAGESQSGSSTRAPITAARYRIQGPGGYDKTLTRSFNAGDPITEINDVMVGTTPGAYTVKVHLIDAAGNASSANDATANLRYDPTVPPQREAQFNGWIRRNDFAYTAEWQPVDASDLGPSGLQGYAVSVTQDPTSDPCVTQAHPSSACSGAEVNNPGIGDTEMSVGEKSEGEWFLHVVPVTGAGVKATEVKHTSMPVDKTDPASSISGASGEWTNQNITVGVSASDALSGMVPNATNFPSDPQPRTCVQVGSATVECEPDADVTRVISAEGNHTIRYFARDLAGNENNGTTEPNGKQNNPPGTASVRLDKTAPSLAFEGGRDVNAPARIAASTSDQLSGVTGGQIELRRQGSNGSWLSLETALEGARLVGEVPDDIDPGRYEFRATGTDRAGNSATTTKRADGSQMVEELPLKEAVALSATIEGAKVTEEKKCKGKAKKAKKRCCKKKFGRARCCKKKGKGKKCKGKGKKRAPSAVSVPYGTETRLKGVLRTKGDAPLRGRTVTVTERMAEGGQPASRQKTTTTDSDGAFAVDLAAGPSRKVTVSFEGDQRYRPTDSNPVDLNVKGKVLAFSSSKRVPEHKSIRFRGRVGAMGVSLSDQGKRVELQYQKSKRSWKTIDSGQTNAKGAFKLRYALRSNYVRKTKVKFRIAAPAERAWPYVGTSTSRARKTVILP